MFNYEDNIKLTKITLNCPFCNKSIYIHYPEDDEEKLPLRVRIEYLEKENKRLIEELRLQRAANITLMRL